PAHGGMRSMDETDRSVVAQTCSANTPGSCGYPGGSARIVVEGPSLSPDDVTDAVAARSACFARDTSAAGVCVADGMGVRIYVERGALVVEDGMGEERRHRRFDKATHGLSRLVVTAATGTWTIDALHWCRRLGIGVLVLAPDGTPVLTSTPRATDDA